MFRDLRPLFFPESVAVLGASDRPESLPGAVLRNLVQGGYSGSLQVVNPRRDQVQGIPSRSSAADLDPVPDLAIIGIPADPAEEAVHALLERGTRAFVMITAGFGETGAEGRRREEALAEACRRHDAMLMGPNGMGFNVITPERRLDASFLRRLPRPGRIALVCQSGSVGEWVTMRCIERELGIGFFASAGNMADLDVPELVSGVGALLPEITQVFLYLETMPRADRLEEALASLPPSTRVWALRGGTTDAGERAVAGHTGALATEPRLAAAVLRRLGITEVHTLTESIDALEISAHAGHPPGTRVAVVTNAGGPAVIATDMLGRDGVDMPRLSPPAQEALHLGLAPAASAANPVDVLAAGGADAYSHAISAIRSSGEIDVLLPIFMPPIITPPEEVLHTLRTELDPEGSVVCWMDVPDSPAYGLLRESGFAVFPEPNRAARAVALWLRTRDGEHPAWPSSIPAPGGTPFEDPAGLEERLLAAIEGDGVRRPGFHRSLDRAGAEDAARRMGIPVALKIERRGETHKVRAGLLALVRKPEDLAPAFDQLAGRSREGDRWLVQRIVPRGPEVFVGFLRHPTLGPFVGFGRGGSAVETTRAPRWLGLPATTTQVHQWLDTPFVHELGGEGSPGARALLTLVEAVARIGLADRRSRMAEVNPAIWDPDAGTLWLVDIRGESTPE